jgi:hypothetical protein
MNIQNINIGNFANDGTGDDLREAFIKVNQNFQNIELNQIIARNLGTSGIEVFAQKENNELQFRRLLGGNDIVLTQTESTIIIESTVTPNFVVISPNGSVFVSNNSTLNLIADEGITISASENTKSVTFGIEENIKEKITLLENLETFNFGNFDIQITSLLDYLIKSITIDLGTIENPTDYYINLGSFNE